jgi:hypothetical protein
VDIEKINDPIQKKATILQIQEFGQIPKQLFNSPHPSRNSPLEKDSLRVSDMGTREQRSRSPATLKGNKLTSMSESIRKSSFQSSSSSKDQLSLEKKSSFLGASALSVNMRKYLMIGKM